MWEKVKPIFMHAVMQDPEIRAGVEARLEARQNSLEENRVRPVEKKMKVAPLHEQIL